MGGRAEGLACADPGARTPIGVSGNFNLCSVHVCLKLCPASDLHLKFSKYEKRQGKFTLLVIIFVCYIV